MSSRFWKNKTLPEQSLTDKELEAIITRGTEDLLKKPDGPLLVIQERHTIDKHGNISPPIYIKVGR